MTKAYDYTLGLLTRREHGFQELAGKLKEKGYSQADSQAAIMECQRLGLQSDERYVEALIQRRINQGYGPLRMMFELKAKQINKELIAEKLNQYQDRWQDYARQALNKKFKLTVNLSSIDMQKQQRFLAYRGFPTEIITKLYKNRQGCFEGDISEHAQYT